LSNVRVRLVLLLAVLATLAAYAVAGGAGIFGGGGGPAIAGDCPVEGAPPVEDVPRAQLLGLREDARRVVSFDSRLRAYEQGPVNSGAPWSDMEPGWNTSPPGALLSGGYELRWWMVTGDDVVADAFVFADPTQAHDFFTRAASAECRQVSTAQDAPFPSGGRNLAWLNPDGFAQEDLFLLRGRRVYRVAVVTVGSAGTITAAARKAAFFLVNTLACALPDSGCDPERSRTLPAAREADSASAPNRVAEAGGSRPTPAYFAAGISAGRFT
jgi:hypothetical protein